MCAYKLKQKLALACCLLCICLFFTKCTKVKENMMRNNVCGTYSVYYRYDGWWVGTDTSGNFIYNKDSSSAYLLLKVSKADNSNGLVMTFSDTHYNNVLNEYLHPDIDQNGNCEYIQPMFHPIFYVSCSFTKSNFIRFHLGGDEKTYGYHINFSGSKL